MRTRREKARAWPLHASALLILACSVVVPGGGRATADGPGNHGLALRVSVNSRPGTGAERPGIRVGDPVRKVYHLINRTGADLYDVRVSDPALPRGVAVVCGGRGAVAMLRGLGSTTCTAETRARPGVRSGEVAAAGRVPSLRRESRAHARAGYRGVGGALALAESVEMAGRRADIRYTVTNRGDRAIHDVRVSDAWAAARAIDCGAGRAFVPRIAPGRSASCHSGPHAPPGTYVSRGFAEASDRTRTLGRTGTLVPPPILTARSSARFTVRAARVQPSAPPSVGRPVGRRPSPPLPPRPVAPPPVPVPGLLPAPPLAPPALLPPPAAPNQPLLVDPVVPPPLLDPGTTRVTPENPPRAAQDVGLLDRLYRPGHGPTGTGLVAIMFLVVLPAVLAAVLLGSRFR